MKAIVLEVLTEILEAWGFVTLGKYDAMIEQCWNRGVQLSDALRELESEKKGVDELIAEKGRQSRWTEFFAAQAKRLREFVTTIASETHPNAKRFGGLTHNPERLHTAALKLLEETREPNREEP